MVGQACAVSPGSSLASLLAHLISHDHQMPIAQRLDIVVGLAMLQAQDLFDVLDLGVVTDLQGSSVAHIEQLAPAAAATTLDTGVSHDCTNVYSCAMDGYGMGSSNMQTVAAWS